MIMAHRIALKPEDKLLLARIRGQHWTADELRWVLAHLDANAPTPIVRELHAKLIAVAADTTSACKRKGKP
jgi:hypothetical protein